VVVAIDYHSYSIICVNYFKQLVSVGSFYLLIILNHRLMKSIRNIITVKGQITGILILII